VKWIIVGGLCLLICGCQGISTGAIRERSARVDASTSRTLTEVATCLTSAPNLEELRGGGSMKILSFPDSKVMEFAIGAIQMVMADGNAPRTSAQTPHRQASFPEPCRLPSKRGYQLRRPPAWGGTSRLLTNGIGALVRRMRTRATGSMTNIHVK
jgi:hypothetical protein